MSLASTNNAQTYNTNKTSLKQALINVLLEVNLEAVKGTKLLGKHQRKTNITMS